PPRRSSDLLPLLGRTHPDPHSWRRSAERYQALLSRVDAGWARPDSPTNAPGCSRSAAAPWTS
ncbi:hypothetical protein, partial [Mycobacterium sp. NAZ190054]|uniref:hypothetical protein n=1 Tax=Mycobacterium sp. NAZ190054 TaxID=1747766 RepID=UPI001E50D820